MKTALAGLAAVSMLVAVAGTKPAEAIPIQKLGLSESNALSNTTQVHYRHYPGRRAYIVRRERGYAYDPGHFGRGPYYSYASPYYSYAPPYYGYAAPYGGYPYGYGYGPGVAIGVGPFGFGFGFGW